MEPAPSSERERSRPRRKWLKRLLFGVAALTLVLTLAIAIFPTARNLALYAALSQVTLSHFEVDGSRLEMTGAVNGKSPGQFERVLDDHPEISTFVLEEVGGSIDDDATFEIARSIRSRGLGTRLPADGLAESGGVDPFGLITDPD